MGKKVTGESNSLSIALKDSLSKNMPDVLQETMEVTLDSFIKDGLLKDLPIIKYVASAYNMVNDIRSWHTIRKLAVFIEEFNRGILDNDKYDEYIQLLSKDSKRINRELDYIVIIVDRMLEMEKPTMLAKLYMAYLEKQISWNEFAKYSIVTERFLYGDYEVLEKGTIRVSDETNIDDAILRLEALGLMIEKKDNGLFVKRENGNYGMTYGSLQKSMSRAREYIRTQFGEEYIQIVK